MTSLLTFVLPWAIALLAVRLAVVVVRREKANDEPKGSIHLRRDDGTWTVRTSAVVLAVLTVLGAAASTLGGLVVDQPYDQDEMTDLAYDVSTHLNTEYEKTPVYEDLEIPETEQVPGLIEAAGFDADRVRVLEVNERLGQSSFGSSITERVQLVADDGRAWACLEWTLRPPETPVEVRRLSVSRVSDWC